MTKILLVRHGATDWNHSFRYQGQRDTELNELGVVQAEWLAERLADEKIDVAYSSDLQRAYRTASIALKYHKIDIIPERRLREMNFGLFEGLNNAAIAERYPEAWQAWSDDLVNTPPLGSDETLNALANRIEEFFEEVKEGHPDQTVLVVAHSGPLRALLCRILHIDLAHFWQYRLDNTSITIIETHRRRSVVALLNDTCHLRGRTV